MISVIIHYFKFVYKMHIMNNIRSSFDITLYLLRIQSVARKKKKTVSNWKKNIQEYFKE